MQFRTMTTSKSSSNNGACRNRVKLATCFQTLALVSLAIVVVYVVYVRIPKFKDEEMSQSPKAIRKTAISPSRLVAILQLRGIDGEDEIHEDSDKTMRSLWEFVGCDSKHPIFTCRKEKISYKGPGNLIAVNRTDFDHPLLRHRQSSCAVVGSSGSLLARERGMEIDKHDIVVRINYPPVKGYEKHVGSRPADIHFLGDHVGKCLNESNHVYLVVTPSPLGMESSYAAFTACPTNTKLKMYPVSRYLYSMAEKILKIYTRNHLPANKTRKIRKRNFSTTGFRALIFSLMICDNVDAFGFGTDHTRQLPHHYFENDTKSLVKVWRNHDPDGELEIVKHWPSNTPREYVKQFGKLRYFP